MSDVVAFLLARIQEDEDAAREIVKIYPEPWETEDRGWRVQITTGEVGRPNLVYLEQEEVPNGRELLSTGSDLTGYVWHVINWRPSRVLAECAAKRAVIEGTDYRMGYDDREEFVLFVMAAVYREHADFDPAWLVTA